MDWDVPSAPPTTYPHNDTGKDLTPLWENKAFSSLKDFTIKVGIEEFKVHKLVIVAASHYFKALLEYADVEDKNLDEAELEGLDPLAVSNLIEYIYTNQITGSRARPEDLLEAASYLQIPAAVVLASRLMKDTINDKNCFDYIPIFELYSLNAEIAYVQHFILSNFREIIKAHDLDKKSYESFLQVVKLWGNPEWELFVAIKKWLAFDEENRKQYLSVLMSEVRFALLTPDELQTIKNLNVYNQSDGTWKSKVDNAIAYHDLPTHRKVIEQAQNKIRQEPTPVVISSHDPDLWGHSSYVLQKDGTWRKFSPDDTPHVHKGVAASVVINNFLVVCGAFSRKQKWHIFDPRTMTWARMAKMKKPRKDFALAQDGQYLYTLGGCHTRNRPLDSIERYNFETNKWKVMHTTLPIRWYQQFACLLSGSIYLTGGFADRHGQCLGRLDRFDPSTETWESKARMFQKHLCYAMNVVTLWGEDFIHIMCPDFIMQYYNPRTDQWSMWTSFSDLQSSIVPDLSPKDRADTTVLAHKDSLYLLNFDLECDGRTEDDDVHSIGIAASCLIWKVRRDSRRVTEHYGLDHFPLRDDTYSAFGSHCSEKYAAGLLAFPRALPE